MWTTFFSLFVLLHKALHAFQPVTENDRVLVGHVFQQLYTRDWFNCIQACHDEPRCISYNYERSAGANGLCELNDCGVEDLCDRDKSLIYSVGFVFQQIRESKVIPAEPPQNVTAVDKTSTSIFITWSSLPTNQRNGKILGYKVIYETFMEKLMPPVMINASTHHVNLTRLGKNTRYIIAVLAFNQNGDGPASEIIDVRTNKDKPDAAPQNITAVNMTSNSILVTWDEVPKYKRYGFIQKYQVDYTPVSNDNKTSQVIEAPTRYLLINNLQNNTNYSITVLACNVIGCGPASQPIFVATNQDKNYPQNS
ncbi:hypothetical protein ACROYT_G016577 [Oculina patagonica]